VCVAAIYLTASAPAQAQASNFRLRGFADVGSTTFAADESFTAVLGSDRGAVFGGGVEAVLPQRVFVNVRVSRFRRTGQRVFLFGGERFGLGIPTTVTVTPMELTAGYRLTDGRRLVPYAGAGIGWHSYHEASRFADSEENVSERYLGYQIAAGTEVRVTRWIGTAVEAQWSTVPDALGADPNSASREFQESNLGGVTLRVKLVIGR
jgi:opacity protein-like surface antigen